MRESIIPGCDCVQGVGVAWFRFDVGADTVLSRRSTTIRSKGQSIDRLLQKGTQYSVLSGSWTWYWTWRGTSMWSLPGRRIEYLNSFRHACNDVCGVRWICKVNGKSWKSNSALTDCIRHLRAPPFVAWSIVGPRSQYPLFSFPLPLL